MLLSSLLLLATTLLHATHATFSIGAVDRQNGLMGAAGASCVYFNSIYEVLYVSVPEKGILLTQAKPASHSSVMVTTAKDMMEQGTDPSIVMGVITDPSLDNTTEEVESECETGPVVRYEDYLLRQYGLVDTQGRYDGYEDETLKLYYEDLCFTEENYGNVTYTQEHVGGSVVDDNMYYTAQGNIIALPTIPAIVDGFTATDECGDMIHRLFQAISAPFLMMEEAIAEDDISLVAGDIRCLGTNQAAAAGIFLHVEDYSGNEIIHIDVVNDGRDDGSYDPYPEFVEQYNAWRESNPCGSFTMAPTTAVPTPSPTSAAFGRLFSMMGITASVVMASIVAII